MSRHGSLHLLPVLTRPMQEIMVAMAAEKPGDCSTTACGGGCGPGQVELYKQSACSDGSFRRRCCTASNYPDVMVMVDKGQGSTLSYRYYQSAQNMAYADYSLLESSWTNAKTLKALPGKQPTPGWAAGDACSWLRSASCGWRHGPAQPQVTLPLAAQTYSNSMQADLKG